MIRCATMQSCCDICHQSIIIAFEALWWCQMTVWFVLLYSLITKIYGLLKKSSFYLNYWESYDNFINFTAAILNVSFQKNPLRITALHRPRYYYGVLSMHNQKRKQLLSAKQGYPHDYRTTLILQTKILKKNTNKHTLHPSILGVRDRETSFAPEYTRGPRLKG